MHFILVQHLDFRNAFAGSDLLSRSHLDKAELAGDGSFHHQVAESFAGAFILLPFPFAVVLDEVFADDGDGRVMTEAFPLKMGIFHFIVVFVLGNFELRLALDAHAVLLLVKGKTLAQAVEVIIGLQGLLLQVQAFLLHFNFFFAVGDKLLFPVVALVFNAAQQVGVFHDEDGISLPEQAPLLSYDAFHASGFTCIDLDGKDGLNHSLHIYIFHKFAVFDFGYLYVVLLDTQFAGTQRKGDYINQEGKEGNASRQIVAVTDVPGFLFKFYIHNAIFYILFFYFSDTPFRSSSE